MDGAAIVNMKGGGQLARAEPRSGSRHNSYCTCYVTHVYIYIYVDIICIYIYIYTYIHIHIHIYVCMHATPLQLSAVFVP